MLKPILEHKKSLLFTALVLVLVLLLPENALAQNNALNSPLQSVLFGIVTTVFGRLVWLGGNMLDYSIAIFVVGFGEQYATTGLGFAIDSLWSTVRDIFNLTFIFGLVYIGFKMIFDSSDSNARKMLGSLVMAALLVNFSLFITKFVIDFSNIAASQFAAAFYSSGTGTYEVAASFMNLLGLSTLWQNGSMVSNGAGYGYIFGTLILFLVAAFVFGAGAILLTIRFVVLNIYMVLSPLMFLGWVFPGFSGVSKDYWKGFLSRAFFAPAYILMIYFSNQILVNLRGSGAGGNMANVFGAPTVSQTTFSSVMPYFILTCVFLISSLVVANKMGAQGATSAIAMGNRWQAKARSMATRLPRSGARMITNKAGEVAGKRLNTLQAGNGWMAKIARTNLVDQAARGATEAATKAQYGTGTTNEAERKYRSKTQSRANQTAAENTRAADFKDNLKALTDNNKELEDLGKALDDLAKTIKGMSKDEKNDLSLAELTNKSVATNLSDDDIKNLEASGNFSAAEVQQVKDARKHGFSSIATHGSTLTDTDKSGKVMKFSNDKAGTIDAKTGKVKIDIDKRKSLVGRGTKEAGNLPIGIFKEQDMYEFITPAMLEERMRNGIELTDLPEVRKALIDHLGWGGLTPSEALKAFPTMPGIDKNPWTKWENGNSNYAAQFFA
jgi:hypothetical protein